MRSGKSIGWLPACLIAALLLGARAEPAQPELNAAAEIKALTAVPVRVVWCQDTGDGSDTMAESRRLRLMGFDTEDGRGERAILSDLSNYAKPLLTPRGDRVVFSSRQEQKIYAVNWDGSGLRPVTAGLALAVWEDPRTSNVWVYAGQWVTNSTAVNTAVGRVRRHLLDQPSVSEPVWDKTLVNIDNFQVSSDGQRAGAPFPWPACGILNLHNGAAKKFGDGCWPSLAPDNSYLLWIFDGAHRNLAFFDSTTGRRWVVNINKAPGIGGFEVYHPRWSNHPRFMAMTGPYTAGTSANRIWGGGAGVEIFIGRFSADFQRIEQWAQVTHNTNGDFYPDVWIAGGRSAGVLKPAAATTAPEPGRAQHRQPSARLVLEARPVELSRVPLPAEIAPYRNALVVNSYQVTRVAEGSYDRERIMVAHWAIRDGRALPAAARDKAKTYRMVLEPFDAHPELEGERLVMDSDDFSLPLYYEAENKQAPH